MINAIFFLIFVFRLYFRSDVCVNFIVYGKNELFVEQTVAIS